MRAGTQLSLVERVLEAPEGASADQRAAYALAVAAVTDAVGEVNRVLVPDGGREGSIPAHPADNLPTLILRRLHRTPLAWRCQQISSGKLTERGKPRKRLTPMCGRLDS